MAHTAIHPGEHLAEQLAALNMSAAELARQIKVPKNRVTQILRGERAITGDTALRYLQKMYELRIAEREFGAGIRGLPRLSDRRSGAARANSPIG